MRFVHACSIILAALLAACASNKGPKPESHDEQLLAPEEMNRDSFGNAVTSPLRDFNMMKAKIPPILLKALADPYARPKEPATCVEITEEVKPLNTALGADIDEPPSDNPDDDLISRDMVENFAYDYVRSAAQDLIPMRSWVRRLSGAERHDKLVRAAILAGGVRRAYLKGLGESRGCLPPATPLHLAEPGVPIEVDQKPQYPIR